MTCGALITVRRTCTVDTELAQLPRPYFAFRATFDQEVLAALLGRPEEAPLT
jgi:hypothetical protein